MDSVPAAPPPPAPAARALPRRTSTGRFLLWLAVGALVALSLGLYGRIHDPTGRSLITLFFTLVIVKRLDHSWRLVRRAAGHNQTSGVVERVFVVSAGVALIAFTFWFLVIAGPGPQLAPTH